MSALERVLTHFKKGAMYMKREMPKDYKYDPRVEERGHELAHLIKEELKVEKLSDNMLWNIYSKLRHVADYWKNAYERLLKEQHALKFNEAKLWIRANPEASQAQILHIMTLLEQGKSVRGLSFDDNGTLFDRHKRL